MGFRFSRRVSILPGLKLNLSGSGVSLCVGAPGFHITNYTASKDADGGWISPAPRGNWCLPQQRHFDQFLAIGHQS